MEKIQLEEEKAAKAEASKLKRQRELEKMRAKSIEMQEKVSLNIMLCMKYWMSQSKLIVCYLAPLHNYFWKERSEQCIYFHCIFPVVPNITRRLNLFP